MNGRLGVGVIGASPGKGWASTTHVPAIRSVPDLELVAVCTSRKESASEAQSQFAVPFAFADPAELIAHPAVDLVVGSVRVPRHFELVSAAIEAGKAILCEWPLGNGLDEARHHPVDPDVVEEHEGLRPVDEEVVDPHRHQIDPDRVVPTCQERDSQLGADAVRGRDEDRLAIPAGGAEEGRERADVAQHLGPIRRAGPRGEKPDGLLAGIDVDAGGSVAETAPERAAGGVEGAPHSTPKRASCAVSSLGNPTS